MLRPQDVYVVLKMVAAQADRAPYARLAAELGMSPSQLHASVQRLERCRLVHGAGMKHRPNLAAVEEFLLHGLPYVFPAERGEMTRGVATAHAAPLFKGKIMHGVEPAPVWPHEQGKLRGISFEPLYRAAPVAALKDQSFYEYLVLADVLRDGRVRERKIAGEELRRRLKEARGKRKP